MKGRSGAAAIVALAVVGGLTGVALALTTTAADDFSSGGYGGSTGSVDWAGNWQEEGESDGPGSGTVRVKSTSTCASGSCLTIERLVGLLSSAGATRSVDLTSATSARLIYHLGTQGGLLLGGSVIVEARRGSEGWTLLHRHDLDTDGVFAADLPVGDMVTIRFRAADLALDTKVGFDDVKVELTLPYPTTTTSTTTTTTIIPTIPTTIIPTITTIPPGVPTITTIIAISTTTTTTAGNESVGGSTTITAAGHSTSAAETAATNTTTTTGLADPPIDVTTTTEQNDTSADESDTPRDAFGPGGTTNAEAVVRNLNPGLISNRDLQAQEDLLVMFGLAAEDIGLDILGSAVLGLILSWASLKRLD